MADCRIGLWTAGLRLLPCGKGCGCASPSLASRWYINVATTMPCTPNVRSSLWLSWQTYARLVPRSIQLNTYETDHFMSHLNVRKIHMKHVWDLLCKKHAFLSSGLRSCRARRSTEETCLRRRSWRWIGAKLGTPDEVQICKWDKGWQGSPYFQDMPKWLF